MLTPTPERSLSGMLFWIITYAGFDYCVFKTSCQILDAGMELFFRNFEKAVIIILSYDRLAESVPILVKSTWTNIFFLHLLKIL